MFRITWRSLDNKMKLLLIVLPAIAAQNDDLFNYGSTDGSNFGPEDWDQVACDDLATCVSCSQCNKAKQERPIDD